MGAAHLEGDCADRTPVLTSGWKEKGGAEPRNPLAAACWKRPDSPEKEPEP